MDNLEIHNHRLRPQTKYKNRNSNFVTLTKMFKFLADLRRINDVNPLLTFELPNMSTLAYIAKIKIFSNNKQDSQKNSDY